KPMFYQAIVLLSTEIKPIYGKVRTRGGRVECDIVDGTVPGAKLLGAYVADLFMPGAEVPFRQQAAGRELLDPGYRHRAALRMHRLIPGDIVFARDFDSGHGANDRSDRVEIAQPR